ncbi:MAG: hypothetical protein M1821_003092 [Bathelium mastoideum]|nr:MAG: hypothetical protein M1821_003092 [Bathelium mastoideum]
MPKRLVICCDGTWCSADKGEDNLPSNVALISRMIACKGKTSSGKWIDQVVYYQTGVGTGATGTGLDENIITAYHFLAINYADGDEIFTFGFSRGAYTARALAGCLTEMGLLKAYYLESFHDLYQEYKAHGNSGPNKHHDHDKNAKTNFRECSQVKIDKDMIQDVTVKIVGVWDTVGSLGLPRSWLTRLTRCNAAFKFHDTALNDRIEHAFHALALDEHRGAFTPTLWYLDPDYGLKCDLKQCWFPGYHADVGGGTTPSKDDRTAIDEAALAWMCDLVDGMLTFDETAVKRYLEKGHLNKGSWSAGEIKDPLNLAYRLSVAGGDVLRTPGMYHSGLQRTNMMGDVKFQTNETFHPSIMYRKQTMGPAYDPPALGKYGEYWGTTAPAWQYVDSGKDGEGAEWIRPEVPKLPGRLYGSYPGQEKVVMKEWVIKNVPGRCNMESMLLPSDEKDRLNERNIQYLEANGWVL